MGYVYGTDYREYLQRKRHDQILWRLDQQNLNLVASREELSRRGFQVGRAIASGSDRITRKLDAQAGALREDIATLSTHVQEGLRGVSDQISTGFENVGAKLDDVNETLQAGLVTLHADLSDIGTAIDDFSARVGLEFGRLEVQLGGLSDLLTNLLQVAKTPEQTWAYEQFDIGRDALRRRLYQEAIEHFSHAINGYKDRMGYKLDHRPHHMLGIIRRGEFDDFPSELVDLAKSEQAYLNAARYAKADCKDDAARALCGAGEAAYANGNTTSAITHLRSAVELSPASGEAHFLLAKCAFQTGNVAEGLSSLKKAITSDEEYALRCFDLSSTTSLDGFSKHREAIARLITEMKERVDSACNIFYHRAREFSNFLAIELQRISSDPRFLVAPTNPVRQKGSEIILEITSAQNALTSLVDAPRLGGYLDSLRGEARTSELARKVDSVALAAVDWLGAVETTLDKGVSDARSKAWSQGGREPRLPAADSASDGAILGGVGIAVVSFVVLFLAQCDRLPSPGSSDFFAFGRWLIDFVWLPVYSIIYGLLGAGLAWLAFVAYRSALIQRAEHGRSVQLRKAQAAETKAAEMVQPIKAELRKSIQSINTNRKGL